MKKNLSIIMCILMICILAQGCNTMDKSDTNIDNNPVEASQVLLSSFQTNGSGNYIYPENYAGEWIEGNYLYIAVVDNSKRNRRQYEKILEGYDCIQFVEAEYSLNHLNTVKEAAAEEMNNHGNLVCYYIDYQQNKMVFEFEDLDYQSIKGMIDDQTKQHNAFGLPEHIYASSAMFVIQEGEATTTE